MKRAIPFILSLGLLAALLVCGLLAGLGLWALPNRAERAFGPPAAGLGWLQRTRLAYRLVLNEERLKQPLQPFNAPDRAPLPFEVRMGESTQAVARNLEQAGLIADAGLLTDYMVYAGLDRQVQTGAYLLSPRLSPIQIAQALQDATPQEVTFRVLPGWRLEEVAEGLPTSGLSFAPQAFLAAARNPSDALRDRLSLPPDAGLEGYLFPDRYRLRRDAPLDEFLNLLTQDFAANVGPDLQTGFEDQGLSLHQAVTLASIVQREAMVEDEMPMIASVFLNRLAVGMNLQADPTVQYALGYSHTQAKWWKAPLDPSDLELISPYNTYQVSGLPPGPICSPGLSALQAVAHPAQTPYYYFRAACDGSGRHNFARSLSEHQQNACP